MERPRLRPGLAAERDNDPRYLHLWDPHRLSDQVVRVDCVEFNALRLFDGTRSLDTVQLEMVHRFGGAIVPVEALAGLVRRLDAALFLDSPRLRGLLGSRPREPACVGCYPADPDELRRQLRSLFTHLRGPGLPRDVEPDGHLIAALLPHIDYDRGRASYAWGFKEVFEHTRASLFVIIATSHYSRERFILTRQDFKTPLGLVSTDQDYIDRLVAAFGDGLFNDPFAHVPEHSIELEVVFLQYLYAARRPIRIVPLLVGSFEDDCVQTGKSPTTVEDIARMVQALREVGGQLKEPVCYIISGDLAHIGPKFGDDGPLTRSFLEHSRTQDQALIRAAEAASPADYFRVIVEEQDRRRICGFPPTITLLEAIRPERGRLLHYDQFVDPDGHESVSFASLAFYTDGEEH
ncbi:MAG TPA: AmmeMemoRadiSam system protein B [Gemmataceae bacterium]|nr:AmmeMemoRadiSam system protein B [Gemmataceae bacterium]